MIRLISQRLTEQGPAPDCVASLPTSECPEADLSSLQAEIDSIHSKIWEKMGPKYGSPLASHLSRVVTTFCEDATQALAACDMDWLGNLTDALRDQLSEIESQTNGAKSKETIIALLASLITVPLAEVAASAAARFLLPGIRVSFSRYLNWLRSKQAMRTPIAEMIYANWTGQHAINQDLSGDELIEEFDEIIDLCESDPEKCLEEYGRGGNYEAEIRRAVRAEISCAENVHHINDLADRVANGGNGQACTLGKSVLETSARGRIVDGCEEVGTNLRSAISNLEAAIDEHCGGCERLISLLDRAEDETCNDELINEIEAITNEGNPQSPDCQQAYARAEDIIEAHETEC